MQAMRACMGHVLQEQTHTGLLRSEVASIPAGPLEKNTGATGMVFAVNTVVLQCRCEGGGRVARACVCVCVFPETPIIVFLLILCALMLYRSH